MLKFIRSKGHQQPTAERVKLQKELYAFRKVSRSHVYIKTEFLIQQKLYKNVESKSFLISKKKLKYKKKIYTFRRN